MKTFVGNLNNFKKTLENNKYNVIEFTKQSDQNNHETSGEK